MSLPPLLPWPELRARLLVIFPEGTPGRPFLVREATAKTIFAALYVGAVAGQDVWIAPRHVVRMSGAQAARQGEDDRRRYHGTMSGTKAPSPEGRWYAENTREPLRELDPPIIRPWVVGMRRPPLPADGSVVNCHV